MLETDSLSVVRLLSDNNNFSSTNLVLLEKCKDLLVRDWTVEVSHIFREANIVTDGMANWALLQPVSQQILIPSPTNRIRDLLLADQHGVPYPRRVNNMFCFFGRGPLDVQQKDSHISYSILPTTVMICLVNVL